MAPRWCHDGVMDLTSYVESIRHELAVAADAGGAEARALAERLVAPLESAVRLALLEALSAAAAEITRDLAPGSVDVRLRGREPSFVVTPPPIDEPSDATTTPSMAPVNLVRALNTSVPADGDEGATARINFRLPEHLKTRIEEAASLAGLSVNSWLVRAAAVALAPDDGAARAQRPAPRGGQSFSGWVR